MLSYTLRSNYIKCYRIVSLSCLLFFSRFNCQSQNLNTLEVKRIYSSEADYEKANPSDIKNSVSTTDKSIQIFNQGSLTQQINRSSIPSDLNSFILSPKGDYFVAFEEAEKATDYLYFFRSDGNLLSKHLVNIYPNVKYSTNGEYVIVFNSYGSDIFLFDKSGNLSFTCDYTDLIKDKSKILYNVFFSENGNDLLINAGNDAHLVTTKDRVIKFKTSVGRVIDGDFRSDKEIVLKTASERIGLIDLKILSKSNGLILDTMNQAKRIELTINGVVVFKNSGIVEYEFK